MAPASPFQQQSFSQEPKGTLTAYPPNKSAIYDVRGGTRAVIFDRLSGVKKDVVEEGTHFLIPWLQKAVIYDVRTKARNISTTTGSKDLQMVSLTLRVLHRPNVVELPRIYQVSFSFNGTEIGSWIGLR
jgi:regulator of protease activity HflC (stomatin/prohibitin superfamily)